MKQTLRTLAVMAVLAYPIYPAFAQIDDSMTNLTADERAVVERSRSWIEEGFSPGEDTQNYTYERYLEGYYDPTPGGVVLHDNNDPQMRIETDARAYAGIWEELFAQTEYVANEWTRLYQVRVEGNLALVAFTADAIVDPGNGERQRFPVFYTLVWERSPDGWVMIHEHGSNLITEPSPVR